MKIWQANIGLLLVAVIWGAGFIASEYALVYLKPLQMQIFRFGIASIILSILFFRQISKASLRSIYYGSILGVVFFIGMSLQSIGLNNTTVSKNAFITVTNVVWVPIILYVFKKVVPTKYLKTGLIIVIIGFFILIFNVDIFNLQNSLLFIEEQISLNKGDFYTLLCAFVFSIHIILVSNFVVDENPLIILIFQLYISTILSIVLSSIFEGDVLAIDVDSIQKALFPLLFMALFSSIISFGLQLTCQRYVSASNTAVICSLESLFAAIFAVLLGIESFSTGLIIGAILITVGIIYAETGFKSSSKN